MQTGPINRYISIASVTLIVVIAVSFTPTHAQTLTTVHQFVASVDGKEPEGGLTLIGSSLYGTTSEGGPSGHGTLFRIDMGSKLTTVHAFSGKGGDGSSPISSLLADAAGNIYGVTLVGGMYHNGIVYKLDTSGTFAVLHNFCPVSGCADGSYPNAGLAIDAAGNLYGTTSYGGSAGGGTVFKLDVSGKETVLYNFCTLQDCVDGEFPITTVILDSAGNIYGTTFKGGPADFGVVFKVDSIGMESVLHSFSGQTDGGWPGGNLIRDGAGNLYGTTELGGTNFNGTAFKLDTSGNLTNLYNFCSATDCTDGALPAAGVIAGRNGDFYGTAFLRGDASCTDAFPGCGTVFKLSSAGDFTLLQTFHNYDGANPIGNLVMSSGGALFGVTELGGNLTCQNGWGCGAVFKITP